MQKHNNWGLLAVGAKRDITTVSCISPPGHTHHSRTQSPFTRGQQSATRGSGQIHIKLASDGYNEGYCSNTRYILLPGFYGIRFWIWEEPLVAPRVRRALGMRMTHTLHTHKKAVGSNSNLVPRLFPLNLVPRLFPLQEPGNEVA